VGGRGKRREREEGGGAGGGMGFPPLFQLITIFVNVRFFSNCSTSSIHPYYSLSPSSRPPSSPM